MNLSETIKEYKVKADEMLRSYNEHIEKAKKRRESMLKQGHNLGDVYLDAYHSECIEQRRICDAKHRLLIEFISVLENIQAKQNEQQSN